MPVIVGGAVHVDGAPWRLLRGHVLPFVQRLGAPNIGAMLLRTTEVSSAQGAIEVAPAADLGLRPPRTAFGVLAFARIDEIVEAGFRYARQRRLQRRGKPAAAAILPPSVDQA